MVKVVSFLLTFLTVLLITTPTNSNVSLKKPHYWKPLKFDNIKYVVAIIYYLFGECSLLKLKKLDLHGIKHQDVARIVENFVFLNQNEIPLEIVCGNSQRMIDLVSEVLNQIECEQYDQIRFDTIIVRKL
jgi:hypothetical protein